eukprot:1649-Alexandrium_andersonii.AAC.1
MPNCSPHGRSPLSGGLPRQRPSTREGGFRPTRMCRADVPTPSPLPPGPEEFARSRPCPPVSLHRRGT